MSRHIIRKDDLYEVVVGYDDPLDTFFAQVYDVQASASADDDVYRLLTGDRPREVVTLEELCSSVEAYALVPSDVREALVLEWSNRQPPTEFQRSAFHLFTGDHLP